MLREALGRTLRLRELMADERLRSLAGSVDGLPSLPRIYGDLTAALESPSCGAAEIAAVVCRDPALAAKILQLVNSSFFGLPRPLTALPQAVAYLGVATVRSLVLSTEAMSLFRPAARAVGLDVDALSARAVATAAEAARLAAPEHRSDAFTAGLLSDVGLLLLAAKAPELLRQDEASLGFAHGGAGAYLLGPVGRCRPGWWRQWPSITDPPWTAPVRPDAEAGLGHPAGRRPGRDGRHTRRKS